MNEELLWKITENHFWRCKKGYQPCWIHELQFEERTYLLELVISGKTYRAAITGNREFHFYAYECLNTDETLIPENWLTDWDEPLTEEETRCLQWQ